MITTGAAKNQRCGANGGVVSRGLAGFLHWRAAAFVAAVVLLLSTYGGAAVAQGYTLTKTPNPITYSAVGEVIDYTYVITNPNSFGGFLDSISDDRIATIDCPSNEIPPNDSLTCTASYTIQEGDVTEGSVTNIVTAVVDTCGDNCFQTFTAQATINFAPPPTGSINIVKNATGGDDTFSFTSTVPGAGTFDLTTAGGTASRNFASLNPGTYTFIETNLPADWNLTTLSCAGDAGGAPTTFDLATRTASVGLDSGEAITCTYGNTLSPAVPNPIRPFLAHRLTFLADGPDRHRIFRRITSSFWGDTGGNNSAGSSGPFALVGNGDDNNMQMSVATSLLDLSRTYAQANGTADQLPTPGVDVWLEVHYSEFEDEGSGGARSDGHFGVAYLGVDYLVTPSVLVGVLGQIDWGEEDSNLGSEIDGIGGMAGPYLSARLTPNLFFTTRAAYGISENEVSPIGTYTDDFSTDRWLASAELTGNWNVGNFRITPGTTVTYLQEDQHGYTDSRGVAIPSQTVSLGQVTFGPEVAYRFVGDRFTWEPHLSVTGIWDFDDDDGIVAGLIATDDDFRARMKAGVLAQAAGGASFRIVGTLEGVGNGGYDAYGAQAWLSIPLR